MTRHHIRVRTSVFALPWIGGAALLASCSSIPVPDAPRPPQIRYQSTDELLASLPTSLQSDWMGQVPDWKSQPVGYLEFDGDPSGAPAATQEIGRRLTSMSRDGRLKAADRTRMDAIVDEMRMNVDGWTTLTRDEQVKRLGRQVPADYLLLGSVNEFESSQQTVPLKAVFVDGEMDRYRRDHAKFLVVLAEAQRKVDGDVTASFLPGAAEKNMEAKMRIEHLRSAVLPPEYYENDLHNRQRTEFMSIARVGLAARLIDVKTSTAVWFFRGEKAGSSLSDAMPKLLEDMIKSLLSAPAPASGS